MIIIVKPCNAKDAIIIVTMSSYTSFWSCHMYLPDEQLHVGNAVLMASGQPVLVLLVIAGLVCNVMPLVRAMVVLLLPILVLICSLIDTVGRSINDDIPDSCNDGTIDEDTIDGGIDDGTIDDGNTALLL